MDLNDLKIGTIILWEKQPVQVIWSNRMRTAQRKPVMQTKLRNVITGKVYEYSFKFGESIDEADVVREKANFLYADADGTHFMNNVTFETVDIPKEITEEQEKFLKEGMEVSILRFNNKPVSVELPIKVELKVMEAPPDVKGNSAGKITKPVKMETGLMVDVPMFIKEDDVLRIDSRSGEYVERATQ
ncbi:MAG: elongation factor P [Candidatus Doudnabacteria bacterium]|nr:elongation factor P [Candidatus Doudnabacteria bacterium]